MTDEQKEEGSDCEPPETVQEKLVVFVSVLDITKVEAVTAGCSSSATVVENKTRSRMQLYSLVSFC